jgi:hypothetical protein
MKSKLKSDEIKAGIAKDTFDCALSKIPISRKPGWKSGTQFHVFWGRQGPSVLRASFVT